MEKRAASRGEDRSRGSLSIRDDGSTLSYNYSQLVLLKTHLPADSAVRAEVVVSVVMYGLHGFPLFRDSRIFASSGLRESF